LGLSLIVAAIVATLLSSPLVVVASNSIRPQEIVATTRGDRRACQKGETLPADISAIRIWITGNIKPNVRVQVEAGSRIVTSGYEEGGQLGKVVTVPVAPVPHAVPDASVCFALGPTVERIHLIGGPSGRVGTRGAGAKVVIEYLRPSDSSWWSLARSVVQHMGLGRALEGWSATLVPLILMILLVAIVSLMLLRQLGSPNNGARWPASGERAAPSPVMGGGSDSSSGSIPQRGPIRRARGALRLLPGPAWACACVACLSAVAWSILMPPLEATDEPSHFSYVQVLAETGSLPTTSTGASSPNELVAMRDLNVYTVHFNPAHGTIYTEAQEQRLKLDLATPYSRISHDAGSATSQPPLYYALETVPYKLGSLIGDLLDQLALMRLLSALMAALSACFVYLFLREALPASPWAWTVGGLGTALAPLLGYIGGAVNPDAMLCAVSAALFYTLARAFRRGLSSRRAIAIGAVVAIGFLTKLNFIGLAPGVLFALVILARRATRASGHLSYRPLGLALAIGLSPVCLYVIVNALSGHPALGLVTSAIKITKGRHVSLPAELSCIWQYFLPRLPGMHNYFPGVSPLRQLWFDRLVGDYGWLDTYFPNWVYNLALILFGVMAALSLRGLFAARTALRSRAGELISYAAIGVGVLVLVGADSYLEWPTRVGGYSEPRYLLPLAALFAAAFTLAARGAGRRWGPAVGTLLVLLILAHDIFSQLLVVGRYYA
jgi:hypothetical protein